MNIITNIKNFFSVYIDNTKDNFKNEDKYEDNKEITGNFLIYLEITLYIDPSLKEDNCEIKNTYQKTNV